MPRKKKEETIESKPIVKGKIKTPNVLRGFKDVLPIDQKYWTFLRKTTEQFVDDYNFQRIETPIVEESVLFERGVGKETDIIEKEIFNFEDRGGDKVALRPEITASVCRAYINHGMFNMSQPVKLFSSGPVFRYDRPQSGRYRQFNQLNYEIIGEKTPANEVELIVIGYNFMKSLGLKDVKVAINSIGCSECRKEYVTALVSYFRSHKNQLCEDCQNRLAKKSLRLLDCKEESCQALREEAPQILDWLDDDCKKHFVKVLEFLDELEIPYELDPYLVRGLDYYTQTVFEFWATDGEDKGRYALGGGGRYDDLIEILGGRPTPAAGMGLGMERIILTLKEKEIEVPELDAKDIFVAQLGELAKRKAMVLFEDLRKNGFSAVANFSKDGLRPQLEMANKLRAKYTLILGQKEHNEGTIIIRDMATGIQEVVNIEKIQKELEKRLSK